MKKATKASGRKVVHVAGGRHLRIRARFDSAQPGGTHEQHWANADYLAPDSAATPAVRRILRSRARYEVANNSYANGIVSTLAHYIVGTGPTLRLIPKAGESKRAAGALLKMAAAFNAWAWEVQLAVKLNIMQRAKATDGEGLALLVSRSVPADKVSLGLRVFEADQLSNPKATSSLDISQPEGIELDSAGEPRKYWVLKKHPGGATFTTFTQEAVAVDPGNICHWFDESRPGLHRGLPEIMPALPMFAQLRRYTSAVVTAAEAAADFAGVIQADAPPEGPDDIPKDTVVELEKGMLASLPAGYKIGQVKSENPGPMHEPFIRTIIRELGRCIDMPYAVAAMDASGHNYSSMRGDWQAFFASIRYKRLLCEMQVLDKVLAAWIQEAELVYGFGAPDEFDYVWDWPAAEPTDAVKDAEAAVLLLEAKLTTYAREYSKRGLNAEDELRQRAREEVLLKELNLDAEKAAPDAKPKTEPQKEDGDTQAAGRVGRAMRLVRASRRRRAEAGEE